MTLKKERRGDKELFENRGLWRAITFETSPFFIKITLLTNCRNGRICTHHTTKTGGDVIRDSSKTHLQIIFFTFDFNCIMASPKWRVAAQTLLLITIGLHCV